MSNKKKAEACDRHNNGFGKTKKLMFNQLNFIKYIEFHTKADAISAHGSKVLNEEWITKKLVLNWVNFTRNIKFKKEVMIKPACWVTYARP